ncbi:MAG: NUDIX hydrolase [Actinobacteria bacterium]|nr:NUDIX hydrolase [Actinomycetota bacterium]MCL5887600.1 NUDIX hydrolase [Actinomycetota bacterium]
MVVPAERNPRIRVAALMIWRDEIVLVRHMKDHLEYHLLPGGGVDWGETLHHALKREVLEETGILCSPQDLLFVHDSIDPAGQRHVVNIYFSAHIDDLHYAKTSLDHRVVGIDFVNPDDLTRLDLRPPIALDLIAFLHDVSGFRPRYTGSGYA